MPISAQEWRVRTGLNNARKRMSVYFLNLKHAYSITRHNRREPNLEGEHNALCVWPFTLVLLYFLVLTIVDLLTCYGNLDKGEDATVSIRDLRCPFRLDLIWVNTTSRHLIKETLSWLVKPTGIVLFSAVTDRIAFACAVQIIYLLSTRKMAYSSWIDNLNQTVFQHPFNHRKKVERISLIEGRVYLSLIVAAFITIMLSLLLIRSGDVETNPGPHAPLLTVENMLAAVKGAEGKWERLGRWLLVPHSVRNKIERDYPTSTERLAAMFDYFLQLDPYVSWRSVIRALDGIQKPEIADIIREWAEPISDHTLTVANVTVIIMKTKSDWNHDLGRNLLVPYSVMEKIIEKHSSDVNAQKKAMVEYWVGTLYNASWASLAGVLHFFKEREALVLCEKYLKAEHEVTLTRDNLLKCLEGVTDWDDLGIWLDIPSSKRTEIRNTCQNDLHCINAVVDEYLNHHPAPSWRGIAWAFYRMSKWHEKLRELYDGKRIPDFRSLDPLTLEVEKAIVSQGKLDKQLSHCVFLGPPNTGKSSMMNRFLGDVNPLPDLKDSKSTGSSEKPVSVEIKKTTPNPIHAVVDSSQTIYKWTPLRKAVDAALHLLAARKITSTPVPSVEISSVLEDGTKEAVGHITELHVEPNVPLQNVSQDSSDINVSTNASLNSPSDSSSKDKRHTPISKLLEMVRNDRTAILTAKECFSSISLYLTDTGGQIEFQDLLPLLVSGPSVFLILFRLDKGIDEPLHMKFRDPTNPNSYEYYSVITSRQAIIQTMDTIFEIYEACGKKKSPKILLVGTYKDELGKTKKEIAKRVKQIDGEIFEVVRNTRAYKRDFVLEHSDNQTIFAVSNKLSHLADIDPGLEEIKTRVIEDCVTTVRHPYNWFLFSLALNLEKESMLTLERCEMIAKECRITEQAEMLSALSFLHRDVGLIRHFNQPHLRNTIFRTPQVIFNFVTELILSALPKSMNRKSRTDFRELGIFQEQHLEKIARSHGVSTYLFVPLLRYLHIIAPFVEDGEQKYLMPCVVGHGKCVSNQSTIEHCNTTFPSLVVFFKSGFIPRGLFGAVIVALLDEKNAKWSLRPELVQKNYISLYFETSEGRDTVILKAGLTHIEVIYVPCSTKYWNCHKACIEIRKTVMDNIDIIKKNPLSYANLMVSTSFFCPNCPPETSSLPPSPLAPDEHGCPSKLFCEKHSNQNLPQGHDVWYERSALDLADVPLRSDSGTSTSTVENPCCGNKWQRLISIAIIVVLLLVTALATWYSYIYYVSIPSQTCDTTVQDTLINPSQGENNASIKVLQDLSPGWKQPDTSVQQDDRPKMTELLSLKLKTGITINIIERIGRDYKAFGIHLLKDHNHSKVDNIEHDCSHQVLCIVDRICSYWLVGNGALPVSWSTFVDCLEKSNLKVLADEIKGEYSTGKDEL